MTIVVTGATGHLGRLALEALLARGVAPEQLVAGGRKVEKLADFADRGVRVVPIDFTVPETLDAAFAGAEQVLLISSSEVGQRAAQHAAAIDAAVRAGVSHLVYTSAPKATTSPLILAPEHKATEEAIAASGIQATILRNSWYTENYLQAVQQGMQTGEIVASVGDGRVASASRKDYAEAAAAVLIDPSLRGRVYELSGDVAWNFEDLAAAAAEIAGREVVYRDVSPEEHAAILSGFGLDEGTVGFVVALDQNIKAGLLAETSGDLARLIGRPTTPLLTGLREALATV
ncbi:SDR family oxidoreductase [Lysinimonas soli]|uniref:SDR family oxidoreductase n=1 Tax=Lysinimonas soli TaxID=1074233 RepID=A0ABW0NPQ5_9MICO